MLVFQGEFFFLGRGGARDALRGSECDAVWKKEDASCQEARGTCARPSSCVRATDQNTGTCSLLRISLHIAVMEPMSAYRYVEIVTQGFRRRPLRLCERNLSRRGWIDW